MGNRKVNLEFRCENTIIPNSDTLQMLGITVDNMLKFDIQVAVLKRMRNILPYDIRKNICTSFIVPHFDYCAQTWHFCNKGSAGKLEKVNERAVRFVFRDKCTPYEELLIIFRKKVEQRLHKILCTVYTLVNHDMNPQSLIELISRRDTTYVLRGKDILTMPKVDTTRFGVIRRPNFGTVYLTLFDRQLILKLLENF